MFNLNARLLTISLAAWEAIVVACVFVRVAVLATPFSITEGAAWVLLTSGPIAVAALVLRDSHSSTIAQVLYTAEQTPAVAVSRTRRNP